MREMQDLGSSATPTTVIGDKVITGFNREQLKKLLDL